MKKREEIATSFQSVLEFSLIDRFIVILCSGVDGARTRDLSSDSALF